MVDLRRQRPDHAGPWPPTTASRRTPSWSPGRRSRSRRWPRDAAALAGSPGYDASAATATTTTIDARAVGDSRRRFRAWPRSGPRRGRCIWPAGRRRVLERDAGGVAAAISGSTSTPTGRCPPTAATTSSPTSTTSISSGQGARANPPGTSSHELGTAVDVATPEMRWVIDQIGYAYGWGKVHGPDRVVARRLPGVMGRDQHSARSAPLSTNNCGNRRVTSRARHSGPRYPPAPRPFASGQPPAPRRRRFRAASPSAPPSAPPPPRSRRRLAEDLARAISPVAPAAAARAAADAAGRWRG